jgi:hypothetical protein
VFTRATFDVADVQAVNTMFFRADWDDGIVAWLNGVEIYRSPEVAQFNPTGVPSWAALITLGHESSNGAEPGYQLRIDISSQIGGLQQTGNVLAIGAWNQGSQSSDLVLIPQIQLMGASVDNCPNVPNIPQTDTDGDGIGNACDVN